MNGTSQRVRDVAAELNQNFERLEEMASFQEHSSITLDTKMVQKMFLSEDIELAIKLIENESEQIDKIKLAKK